MGRFHSRSFRFDSSRFVYTDTQKHPCCLLLYRWNDRHCMGYNRLWRIYLVRLNRCRRRIFCILFHFCRLGIGRVGRRSMYLLCCRTFRHRNRRSWRLRLYWFYLFRIECTMSIVSNPFDDGILSNMVCNHQHQWYCCIFQLRMFGIWYFLPPKNTQLDMQHKPHHP